MACRDDFICSICQDLICRPVTMTCGHMICKSHISETDIKNCPVCSAKVTLTASCEVNKVIERVIESQFKDEYTARCKENDMEADNKRIWDVYSKSNRHRYIALMVIRKFNEYIFSSLDEIMAFCAHEVDPVLKECGQPPVNIFEVHITLRTAKVLVTDDYLFTSSFVTDIASIPFVMSYIVRKKCGFNADAIKLKKIDGAYNLPMDETFDFSDPDFCKIVVALELARQMKRDDTAPGSDDTESVIDKLIESHQILTRDLLFADNVQNVIKPMEEILTKNDVIRSSNIDVDKEFENEQRKQKDAIVDMLLRSLLNL